MIDVPAHCADSRTTTTPSYIALEGCIGVGKTTLAAMLGKRFAARTVMEIVEENPFLSQFYEDQSLHAFKTQMFFLLSRYRQQQEMLQVDLFQQSLVSDYLFAKDRIFAQLTLQGHELVLYDQVYAALKPQLRQPDLVIFLRAPVDVILRRIRRRGRSFERDIDVGYLEQLIGAYNRFFATYDLSPMVIVDTDDLDFPGSAADFQILVTAIDTFDVATGKRHLSKAHNQPALL